MEGDDEEVDKEVAKEEEEGKKEEELVKQLLGWWRDESRVTRFLIMQIPLCLCGRRDILIIRRLASSLSTETRAPRRKQRQKIHRRGSHFQINLLQQKSIF